MRKTAIVGMSAPAVAVMAVSLVTVFRFFVL
jgi:hypothetical protein